MTESTVPWRHASPSDPRYREYLASRKEPGGFPPFQRFPEPCRSVMYRILDPNPKVFKRIHCIYYHIVLLFFDLNLFHY